MSAFPVISAYIVFTGDRKNVFLRVIDPCDAKIHTRSCSTRLVYLVLVVGCLLKDGLIVSPFGRIFPSCHVFGQSSIQT